jgi:hypothetical protein
MEFRIADTFIDSLARLTGEEQKTQMGQNRFEKSNVSDPFGSVGRQKPDQELSP